MSVALVYAAEAYHTRGAMRHVVGDLQMHSAVVKEGTTVMDYWASMIENWAERFTLGINVVHFYRQYN